jgi:hypothetical protein
MYHVELRQFPHSAWRFNLGEQELRGLLEPWTRDRIVVFGEQKWDPEKATLTVLEGPKLELGQLSMGRGWRNAQRVSTDVTARLLDRARRVVGAAGGAQATASPPAATAAASSQLDPLALGVQIATLLGPDALALLAAWQTAASASGGLRPSESLALAEQELAGREEG